MCLRCRASCHMGRCAHFLPSWCKWLCIRLCHSPQHPILFDREYHLGRMWNLRSRYVVVSFIFRENSKLADNGSILWELSPCKYRVYMLLDSPMGVSIELLTRLRSSISTMSTPPVNGVKIESGVHLVIDLIESFDEDAPTQSNHRLKPSFPSEHPAFRTPSPSRNAPPISFPPSPSKLIISIVQCLCRLSFMSARKNILKKLDYDTWRRWITNPHALMVTGCLSSPMLSAFPLIPRPNPWTAWTNATKAMFGPRPRPPTSTTT